ncbi:MAG: polymerase sigma-70 factor, subfamily, partial [Frankiaceae bacterium]|nr:polymerase sigma-70 factor, subfamily [Frankiaceae bacterium]
VCLTALDARARRPLPSGLGPASDDYRMGTAAVEPFGEWLEPAPDGLLGIDGSDGADPAGVVVARESVRLAFIAALQHLPARPRAVLLLRDVLGWKAAEVAALLETTTVAVNSALRRARAQLDEVAPTRAALAEPGDPAVQATLGRYIEAFERSDISRLAGLLRDDATLEMPPNVTWFAGRRTIETFLQVRVLGDPGNWRLVQVSANGQPATAAYGRASDGRLHAHGIQVLEIEQGRIRRIVSFNDARLVALFGLPPVLDDAHPAAG